MDPVFKFIKEELETKEYFEDTKKWYAIKYLYPNTQKSYVIILFLSIILLLSILILGAYFLLPIQKKVNYVIAFDEASNSKPAVIRANEIPDSPIASIAKILLRNYVINREKYDYYNTDKQLLFIKNNSTRIVYQDFADFMDINNPQSPLLRYQKYAKRSISITSIELTSPDEAEIVFESLAQSITNQVVENIVWKTTINFTISDIDINANNGDKFDFVVTSYKLQLLEDKVANQIKSDK